MSNTAQTAFISPTARHWSDDSGKDMRDCLLSTVMPLPLNHSKGTIMTISELTHPKPTTKVTLRRGPEPRTTPCALSSPSAAPKSISQPPRTRSSVAAPVGYDKANARPRISHRMQFLAFSTFSIRMNDPKWPFVPNPSDGSFQRRFQRVGATL